MKNLLISLIVVAVCAVSATEASADVTYEKQSHVAKIVIRNAKSGYEYFLKESPKPMTTLIKTCNGDAKYECVYEIKHGKEAFLYKFRDDGWTVAFYDFQYERDTVATR